MMEPPLTTPPAPIHPRVKWGTFGSLTGLGVGKALSDALVSFNWMTPEQGAAVSPILDFIATGLGAFLGGYMPKGE